VSGGAIPAESRILLVRTSALGDIAQSLPVLAALRRALPAAKLGWVVDESFASLLAGHRHLDELFPVPLRRWRRTSSGRARELVRFVRRLRSFGASIALDLMSNHKGALLARLSGARRRIGLRGPERREPSSHLWLNELVAAAGPHSVERALGTLAALGLTSQAVDFAPQAIRCGEDTVPDGEYVFLHPGAAWGNKRYPPAHWGAVARRVAAASGLPIRVGAAPAETALADAVVAAAGRGATRLDAPDLARLVGAIRGARLVLAGDTGATHLARAFGRPQVAVHGPTDPALHGPWQRPGAIVVQRLPCSFCHRRMDEAKACLLRLEPERVAAAALAALEGVV